MKKTHAAVLASLMLSMSLPVFAGWNRHERHERHENRDRYEYRDHYRHEAPRHHHGGSWILPGLAIGAGVLAYEAFSAPPVVVAPVPRVMLPPPPGVWYFCDMYRAYYPYVQSCPGGWRPVPAN